MLVAIGNLVTKLTPSVAPTVETAHLPTTLAVCARAVE
jgi:hypothetical protein